MKKRDIFIPDIYSGIKIKSITTIDNNSPMYDLSIIDDGTYTVTKDKIIGSNSDMG
jgi:hypothetical protein